MSGGGHGHKPIHPWLDLHGWVEWLSGWNISRALVLTTIFLGLLFVLAELIPNFIVFVFWWAIGTAPIWLPLALLRSGWHAWIEYIREEYLASHDVVLLEVRIPRDIMKSPRAMELVFNAFYTKSGETTVIDRAWKGSVRPFISWELVSFGGEIHFYTWCWTRYRRSVETAIYAQYPEVEIVEADDYSMRFVYDPKKHFVFCTDYIYDPRGDEYPIKSYIDFELDKDPKEEFKIDPFANVIEVMSNLKPNEQAWIQIIVRTEDKATGHNALNPKSSTWKKRVEQEVNKIRRDASVAVGKEEADESDPDKYGTFPRPTWKQTRTIETLERHLGKIPFEVGMRGMYISEGAPHGPTYTNVRWIWKPFNSPAYLNQLRPRRAHNDFDYPWHDIAGYRWRWVVRYYLDAYRTRSFFYTPYGEHGFVMTPETLATIYHYPSRTVAAPGLQRISAKKAEPPPNLPR
jgi:hypothetical protein